MTTSDYTSNIPYGYCHCGCGNKTRIATKNRNDTAFIQIKGQPLKYLRGHDRKIAIEERFWSKVNKNGSIPSHVPHLGKCWEWTANISKFGYGNFYLKGDSGRSHRIAWRLTFGEIPDLMHVLHKCDNRKCVNPAHLFLGTEQDNSDDKFSKGRHISLKGEDNPIHKLTTKQVNEIRQLFLSGSKTRKQLAEYYSVNVTTIAKIIRNESWSE